MTSSCEVGEEIVRTTTSAELGLLVSEATARSRLRGECWTPNKARFSKRRALLHILIVGSIDPWRSLASLFLQGQVVVYMVNEERDILWLFVTVTQAEHWVSHARISGEISVRNVAWSRLV